MAAKKQKARSARWAEAAAEARSAYDTLEAAIYLLGEIQSEYDDWLSNLPENLINSALGEKLTAVIELDFDVLGQVDEAIGEAENIDLPMGFGRD